MRLYCWTQSLLCGLLACLFLTLLQNCDGFIILCRRPTRLLVLGEKLPHEIASSVPNYNDRAKIEVESEIILPFTSDVAFDAFADLRRQPSFSKWLKSVDYIDGSTTNRVGSRSKWTIAFSGMRFSWKAESKQLDREQGIIEWGSVTGLRNEGKVQFATLDGSSTQMRLSMRIYVPKFAVRLMGSNSGEKLAKMIEKRMLCPTLDTFRELVSREMVVKMEKQETLELIHDNNDYSDRQKVAMTEEHAKDLMFTSTRFQPVVPQDQ